MSWVMLFFGFCTVAAILYVLIYAEDHWLDEPDEIQNDADSDSTS